VNRHAKPSSAGSNTSQASSLGSLLRGAFATHGAFGGVRGSGAPFSRLSSRLLFLCLATTAAVAVSVSPALAITVESTSVSNVTTSEATLHAEVNPQGLVTTYSFEYGTDTSYGKSTSSGGAGSDAAVHSVAKSIEGLAPGTTYHYRVVATDTAETLPGADRTFTTYSKFLPETSCPNQVFRIGVGANLPDCRGYEMVSPVDKNGGDIAPFFGVIGDPRASYNQGAIDGNKMTFSSGTPFGDVLSGRNANQYLSSRSASGWTTHGIDAKVDRLLEEPYNLTYPLETAFRLFTPDLSNAWIEDASVTPLTPDAAKNIPNLYRRDNSANTYEALNTSEPPVIPAELEYQSHIRGNSKNFDSILFDSRAPLTPDAFLTTEARYQTYVADAGQLHLVSVLPEGSPNPTNSSGGRFIRFNQANSSGGAMSDDGSKAFWTASSSEQAGSVYLRENPSAPQSAQAFGSALGNGDLTTGSNEITGVTTSRGAFAVGQEIYGNAFPPGTTITAVNPGSLTLSAAASGFTQTGKSLETASDCTEPAKACTIAVSESVAGGGLAFFDLAGADGSKALFSVGSTVDENGPAASNNDLYEFDVETQTPTLVAHKSWGVLGANEDASLFYFVSEEDLAAGAVEDEPNLYLDDEGVVTLIATLKHLDVTRANGFELVTTILGDGKYRGSRVSSDGRHLVFMSRSKALSEATAGYDNTDAIAGTEDREVYSYEVGGELLCVSCNPSGARPDGQLLEQSFVEPGHGITSTWAAAWIPGWEHSLLAQRVLSGDGSRIFFNSYDALVPADSNGVQDVYQWERPGSGDCSEANPSFSARNGGCVTLISSGQSPQLSEFIDATPSGNDVFLTTGSSLVRPDPGLVDIYDARVGGGFDYPTTSVGCEGETCQGLPAPPNDATPASSSYNGPANVKEPAQKKKHKKQKHKKKHKKSKKKGGKSKRAAGHSTRSKG
jgi:hypothetical protein